MNTFYFWGFFHEAWGKDKEDNEASGTYIRRAWEVVQSELDDFFYIAAARESSELPLEKVLNFAKFWIVPAKTIPAWSYVLDKLEKRATSEDSKNFVTICKLISNWDISEQKKTA